jgi:hypothetical protein
MNKALLDFVCHVREIMGQALVIDQDTLLLTLFSIAMKGLYHPW